MAVVVGIHGMAHTYKGAKDIEVQWRNALSSGLREVGGADLADKDFKLVFYGSLFRPEGQRGAGDDVRAEDLSETERELAVLLWEEASRLAKENSDEADDLGEEPDLIAPDFKGRGRTPEIVQLALRQLARSRFFKALGAQRAVLAVLSQVGQVLENAEIKRAVLARAHDAIGEDTKVLIAHSLGSVVAYEAICAQAGCKIETLITLGSPLGIPGVVFDRLTPAPQKGRGQWPGAVRTWTNIADKGDIVALTKSLAPLFPAPANASLSDALVHNGWRSHDADRYLNSKEAGAALKRALS